jgi:mRNA interferase HigB
MTLIGQDVLAAAGKKNKPLKTCLDVWATTVKQSEWHSLQDVRKAYPSADGVKLKSGTVVTVFNTKGGHYRLLTVIDYDSRFVEALEVPTHAEYDKNLWKERH